MTFQIQNKNLQDKPLKLIIEGFSGSGKSHLGIHIADYLSNHLPPKGSNGKVLVIDCENTSCLAYKANPDKPRPHTYDFDFGVIEAPFHATKLIEALNVAVEQNYSAVIIDPLSMFWHGIGGVVERSAQYKTSKGAANLQLGWNNIGTPEWQRIEAAINSTAEKLHTICLVRSKAAKKEHVDAHTQQTDFIDVPVKARVQNDFIFNFPLALRLNHKHGVLVYKTRPPFSDLESKAYYLNAQKHNSPEDFFDDLSDLFKRGLQFDDLSDLRSVDEIKQLIIQVGTTRQIGKEIISRQIQLQGFNKLAEMPKPKMKELLGWLRSLPVGLQHHPQDEPEDRIDIVDGSPQETIPDPDPEQSDFNFDSDFDAESKPFSDSESESIPDSVDDESEKMASESEPEF